LYIFILMNSIVNMFYGLDNSIENKETQRSQHKNNSIYTPALNQGMNFKNYQNKIKNKIKKDINKVNSKEGFQTSNTSSNTSSTTADDGSYQLAEQSKQILSDTSSGTDNSLQNEYNVTLMAYQKLLAKVSGGTDDYINRVNSTTNTYLNKYIHWTDPAAGGSIMYVTNQGVAKPITDWDIYTGLWGNNGCPDDKSTIDITIPWDSSYLVEGTRIPTKPTLVVGSPITKGESCGNEGNNIYVDKLLTNSSATYNGCYADDTSSSVMTFIGGAPPVAETFITNGNFAQSQIANNSYKYLTWDTTTVPGWNFNCVLANNSSAWGYPMPYPNGNQCVSIQKDQELWTANWMSFSSGVTYTISFDACGRNCCDGSGQANPINVGLEGNTFYSFTPPVNKWTNYSTTFTVDSTQSQRISFKGTWTSGDRSTAIQNVAISKGSSSSSDGTYTYDMCKIAAIDNGYKYFALQNVNTETSMGYCGVSNDSISATKNGTAYVITGGVSLWSTNTANTGSYAYLTDQGALTVYNSSGAGIYNTDNSSAKPSDYLGCYGDTSKRAMQLHNNGKQKYSYQECKDIAEDNNHKYFGLQNSTSGTNAQCALSDDLGSVTKYGKAGNCTKLADGSYSGGGWSNAVYSFDPSSFYFLILQDDANMCIYRGTGPNDNQGAIWCSSTNGQQQKANPAYAAAKGKYGKNWIASGSGLSAGDFVGSTDGSIYLIMQSDGNLVLYTSQDAENCQTMKDGNTGGGENANALYEMSSVGIPGNMGKVAYVDSNSVLYPYPDSSIGLSNDYNTYADFSSAGHDISGTSFSNATVDSCKSACNDLQNCYGFDFDKTNNVCYPKDNTMYPKGSKSTNTSVDLYVRKPKLTSMPIGVSDKIFNIDSLTYDNYTKSDKDIGNSYGLSTANSVEKQQLDQLKTRLDQISQQLADNTGTLNTDEIKVVNQSTLQNKTISKYLKEYENTNNKIKNYASNMNGIVRDSDINILKENYNYYFWSILAVGTVLVTMNITKN
jgi:hypothetical protein